MSSYKLKHPPKRYRPPVTVKKGDILPTKENLAILWDFIKYNHPWVFGDIPYLFKLHAPTSIQQWRVRYQRSGIERNEIIHQSPPDIVAAMNHYRMACEDPDGLESLPDPIKQMNYMHGRTSEQIEKMSWFFTVVSVHNRIVMTRDDAQAYVEKRIFIDPFYEKTIPTNIQGTIQPDAQRSEEHSISTEESEAERILAP